MNTGLNNRIESVVFDEPEMSEGSPSFLAHVGDGDRSRDVSRWATLYQKCVRKGPGGRSHVQSFSAFMTLSFRSGSMP
jgi:hypothetical protein